MNKVEEVPSDSLPSWKTKQWRLENRLDRLGVSHPSDSDTSGSRHKEA